MTTAARPSRARSPATTPPGGARPPSTRSIRAASPTPTATGSATSAGITSRVPYLRRARDRRGLAEPVLPVGARRRRLRRRRLPRRRPAAGHARRLRRDARGAARGGHPRRRRHRAQPHLRPARVVPGGARGRPRVARRAIATSSATGRGPDGAEPPTDWESVVRRLGVGAGRRRPVVPALLRGRAARPQLGQPRGARRLRAHAAVLVRSRRRRLPHRRRAHADEGSRPSRCRRRPSWTPCPATASTRSSTATTCTRSTPSGARSSTSTTRRARRSPRRGSTARGVPLLRERREPRPGVQLRPARGGLRRRASSAAIVDRQPRARRGIGLVHDVGALQPRRRPACHALRAAAPGARRRRAARAQARQRVAAVGRQRSPCSTVRADSGARGPPRSSCSALPGLGLPVPGRGARPARGRRDRRCRTAGPDVLPQSRRRRGTGRMPRPPALAQRRHSFGFGADGAHLPQPAWFAELASRRRRTTPPRR